MGLVFEFLILSMLNLSKPGTVTHMELFKPFSSRETSSLLERNINQLS